MLPARNVKAPIAAEAAPAFSLSLSKARAVAEGNINPTNIISMRRQLSKYMNDRLLKRQNAVAKAKTNNPEQPANILFFVCLKRIDKAEPTTIPMEFNEKQRLNTSGENP